MVAQFDSSKYFSKKNTMWNLPPKTWFKLNFGGSTMMGSTTARGVLCNSIGKMVMNYFGNCRGGSNNEVETLALLWGLRLMRKHGINRLTVEGALMLIIKATKSYSQSSWVIKVIIDEFVS